MAQQYDNTNSGALFQNDKGDNEKRPDRRGPLTVQCPHCGKSTEGELAGWLRQAQNSGQRFLSVKWQPKDDQKHQQGGGQTDRSAPSTAEYEQRAQDRDGLNAGQPGGGDLDDEIPFSPVNLLP